MRSAPLPAAERRYAQRLHDEVVEGRIHRAPDQVRRPVGVRLSDGMRYLMPLAVEQVPGRGRKRGRMARLEARTSDVAAEPFTLVMVYRCRNARTVQRLLAGLGPEADIRLWALDEVAPELATSTVGCGTGPKFGLINKLLAAPVPSDHAVVVADDDVAMVGGGLSALLAAGRRYDLDLFQPAHSWLSIYSHAFLLARPWLAARRTTFVEIGPLFVVGPGRRDAFLPFPEDAGMGWGLEVAWYGRHREGARLGVIDGCRMLHLGPVGSGYDSKEQAARNRVLLDRFGARSVYELMRVQERHRAHPVRRGEAG